VNDTPNKWKWYDFVFQYYFGGGAAITLTHAGILGDVIKMAHTNGINQVGEGVERQVLQSVRKNNTGKTSDTFSNGYNFIDVNYVLRMSKVSGVFEIEIEKQKGYLVLRGIVSYNFEDFFQDPLDLMQIITYTPQDIIAYIQKVAIAKNWDAETLAQIYKQVEKIHPSDVAEWIQNISEPFGTPYPIAGDWKTKIIGTIRDEKGN
jgi:hypothetical protein